MSRSARNLWLSTFGNIRMRRRVPPESIHEGGELGYALAVSFGEVMDSPDLIAVCVVGDGEAETGPTENSVT
jgi:phosphoketolase